MSHVTEPKSELTPEQRQAERAARIAAYCQSAGLQPMEVRVLTLHVQGKTPRQIGRKARIGRVSDVQETLAAALAKLHGRPEFHEPAKEFRRNLVRCAANRGMHDDRPPGLSGVAPAEEAKGFRAGKSVTSHHPALRQGPESTARLWGQSFGPCADDDQL